ncbi:T9SS type B sorting domain-containing protein [Neolewinella litorea]|nr:gliding motility-associated C-terminal domain-containing protein [Neolewinella litorea]
MPDRPGIRTLFFLLFALLGVTGLQAQLALTVSKADISCLGERDGTITVSATGGSPAYDFSIVRTRPATPPVTGSNSTNANGVTIDFSNLDSGEYTVTVTDAAGNSASDNVEIEEPNITTAIEVVQEIQCFDDTNGILEAVVFDGSNPISDYSDYTFRWSNGATTRRITDLGPSQYTVTATNTATDCETTDTETLRSPGRLVVNSSQLRTDPATCSGVSDGTVDVPISGGTKNTNGNYRLNWSDGLEVLADGIRRTDLQPGNYEVTVTDANNCMTTTSFVVAAEKTLLLTAAPTDISCFGDANGSISVTAGFEGATPDYPFESRLLAEDGTELVAYQTVGNQGRTPRVYEDLGPGTYLVVLRDQDSEGCTVTDTITINEPPLLEIDTVETTDFGCPDEFGTARVVFTGGTAPYTFRFKNDSLPNPSDTTMRFDTIVMDTSFLDELQPDTNYVAFVTDANGCIDSLRFKIFSPPRASIQPIAVDSVSCPSSSDGQLFTVVTPPQGETVTETAWYRINNDGTIGEQVDIGTRTTADLSVGFYLFEATISNQCVSQAIGEVASPGLVGVDSVNLQSPVCLGDANGSIFVYPTGGTPPYRYDWSVDGASTSSNSITNLTAGTYRVTITDANNCQPAFDTLFELEDPVGISGSFTDLQGVSCPDETTADGSATFEALFSDGSSGSFDFYWSSGDTITGATSATVTGLTRGPISVTVTDGICPQVFTDTITSPEEFNIAFTTEDVNCFGQSDGSVVANVTGGTPAYTYEWIDRPETGSGIDSLPAGSYSLLVTDAQGCSPDTAQAIVNQPDPLTLSINPTLTTPTVTCAGDSNGVVAVFVSSTNNNPLADRPYRWSSNVADNDDNVAGNLTPGTYAVTVTDVEGCRDSLQYTIIDPQPITFAVEDIQPPLCFGEMTTVLIDTAFGGQSSGFDDFTFTLNNDGFLMPIDQPGSTFAGEVVVTVFDSVGCRSDLTLNVEQPEEIVIDLPERLLVDLGDTLQQLTPVVNPMNSTYRYLWTPAEFLSSDSVANPFVTPLQTRIYTLTVTNENGCQAMEDILVEVDANRNVYLPNAFSPNQDGRNEDFRVYACQGVVGVPRVNIFNRWGGLVYEAVDIPANCLDGTLLWDGMTPNGQPVDLGVYVYTVEVAFIDGVTLLYRGDVTVIR